MAAMSEAPVIVIVGPTASGKTALAIDIALRHGGEIISADSRTIFRDMDIGTAKPSIKERRGTPHWGIDLVNPGERFTAADFQSYAKQKISEIRAHGHIPVIVGGTGLYIDGVIFDYRYPREISPEERDRLELMSVDRLRQYCLDNNIKLPFNDKNKRHIIRSIIHNGIELQRSISVLSNIYVFGIAVDKSTLRTRISRRTEQMFDAGVVQEAIMLGKKYGWDNEAMTGNIYPLVREYLEGGVTLEEVKQSFNNRDWQLAKRQMTWFRRNPEISWGTPKDISERVKDVLVSGQIM